MMPERLAETGHVIPRLTLTEVFPLYPFLMGRPALTCVEVGGNVGLWCEAFFDVFAERVARYDVFEPLPGNLQRFRDRLNHIDGADRVALHEMCAGDSDQDVTLHYDAEVTPLASVLLPEVDLGGVLHRNDRSAVVPQRRLDDLLDGPVDLLKIDTEGYEWNVLAGAERAIRNGSIANILLEFGFHQNALGQSFRQFYDFFDSHGYQVYRQECDGDFFGFRRLPQCRWYDETRSSQYMVLASRDGPHPDYVGPAVTGIARRRRRLFRKAVSMAKRLVT